MKLGLICIHWKFCKRFFLYCATYTTSSLSLTFLCVCWFFGYFPVPKLMSMCWNYLTFFDCYSTIQAYFFACCTIFCTSCCFFPLNLCIRMFTSFECCFNRHIFWRFLIRFYCITTYCSNRLVIHFYIIHYITCLWFHCKCL